jgi:hypothetical protein
MGTNMNHQQKHHAEPNHDTHLNPRGRYEPNSTSRRTLIRRSFDALGITVLIQCRAVALVQAGPYGGNPARET